MKPPYNDGFVKKSGGAPERTESERGVGLDWRREPLRCTCSAGLGGNHSSECMMTKAKHPPASPDARELVQHDSTARFITRKGFMTANQTDSHSFSDLANSAAGQLVLDFYDAAYVENGEVHMKDFDALVAKVTAYGLSQRQAGEQAERERCAKICEFHGQIVMANAIREVLP